jgi:endosialidase-like protein
MTTLHLRNSISRSPLRRGLLFIPLALAFVCFALSPTTQAADGGLPGANTAEGQNALFSLTTGTANTALGFDALYHNKTGASNTATGYEALLSNTVGNYNTAQGVDALSHNTMGGSNTANGFQALFNNTTGGKNTANGFQALLSNSTGSNNTANGYLALIRNTIGHDNTANGYTALFSNITGNANTANGNAALISNTIGSDNLATGYQALMSNTTGSYNTAAGVNALDSNTTGSSNIALGLNAGFNLTTGSNNIDIGNVGVAGESNTIRIGDAGTQTATYIAGIASAMVTGLAVYIDTSSGQLGVAPSSQRFKADIKPMDKASEAILALKPVTFRYKPELDPDGIPQFGLVAEEVEKVNPDLVARDAKGEPYTVRYEAVNAMLLNEFLKEHRTVQELKSTAAKQEATIVQQQKEIEALTTGLQKVSAQLELRKPAPQTVANNQ